MILIFFCDIQTVSTNHQIQGHFLKLILHITPTYLQQYNITEPNLIIVAGKLEEENDFQAVFQLTITIIPKHLVQKMHFQDKQYSNLVFIQIGRKVLMNYLNQLNSEVKGFSKSHT